MWRCVSPCLGPTWPLFSCWGCLRKVSVALIYSLGTQSSRKLGSDQPEQVSQPVRVSSQGQGVSCLSQTRAAGLRAALLGMTECHPAAGVTQQPLLLTTLQVQGVVNYAPEEENAESMIPEILWTDPPGGSNFGFEP